MMKKLIFVLYLLFIPGICGFAQTPTQPNDPSTQTLTILSKSPAVYTNAARKKGVSGVVRLRVTFLANGEIGEIIFISETSKKMKLTKYGLVEQAIEAAKKIKFTPQMKNGQPVTVTRFIEYQFVIY